MERQCLWSEPDLCILDKQFILSVLEAWHFTSLLHLEVGRSRWCAVRKGSQKSAGVLHITGERGAFWWSTTTLRQNLIGLMEAALWKVSCYPSLIANSVRNFSGFIKDDLWVTGQELWYCSAILLFVFQQWQWRGSETDLTSKSLLS